MSFLKSPLAKSIGLIVLVIVVMKLASPYTSRVPVVGGYLTLS